MKYLEFIVTDESVGIRLDKYLSENIEDMTRSAISNIITNGFVTVNGVVASKSVKVNNGDTVKIGIEEPKEPEAFPEDIPLDIAFEDDDIIVVNKPKGMVVHPAPGNMSGTLVNALLYHCRGSLSGIGGVLRPGIVHRIDKNTSGLLMVAKNDFAHNHLSQQIKDHSFHREYLAVVYGNIKDDEGVVNAPIGRHKTDRKKMAVTSLNSREAVTHYSVLERFSDYTYIKCVLETGRTHQIRVHMAYLGHPVAGDDVYGPKKVMKFLQGQCLHACRLGFIHPRSGEYMEFYSDPPDVFLDFLNKLREKSERST